jgi:pimeloyl-ACP methyl ester carboxylesterase
LCEQGAHRIAVVGHSLGAVKALYSAALHPHHSTASVIAISPPRLSHTSFAAGTRKLLFQRTIARAQEHLDSGKPETLMRVTYPLPMLITAAGYLEKYGPGEKYNLLRFVGRIRCPVLFAFGQQELESGSAAFAELPDQLRSLSSQPSALQSVTIAGANHDYQGCIQPLAVQLLDWLDSLNEGHAPQFRGPASS